MGAALVREVVWRVSVLLTDSAPQFARWTEAELIGWYNDATLAVVTYLTPAGARLDAIKLRPGAYQTIALTPAASVKPADGTTQVGDLRSIQLVDATCNMGAAGTTRGDTVSVVSRAMKDSYNRGWMAATPALAVKEVMFDPANPTGFFVWPPVHPTTAVWLEILHNAVPTRVAIATPGEFALDGASNTAFALRDEFMELVINYMVARAHMKHCEWAEASKAAAFTSLFVSALNAMGQQMMGVNINLKRLPFAPETPGANK